jgi:O-antigen/teichoic acid export membrane protein
MNIPKIFSLTGSERTLIVKRNILGSFAVKGLSILTAFILVPYTINLLDKEKYGIWITIFSIVTWFNMMDIGIGNGFRNKFAVALAVSNKELAKEYIQTLYSSMTLIAAGLLVLFFLIHPFLRWNSILNIPHGFNENIQMIIGIVFVLFCIQLILKNISTILLALQKTTLSNSLMLFSNVLSLLFIFLFNHVYHATLLSIAVIFMISPILVFTISTIRVFNTELKDFKIHFLSLPRKKYLNDLIGIGIKFFLIQITTIVMFSSSSIIISRLYGPAEVTPYNVAYQLFAAVMTVFSIIVTPFWTAFTDARAKQDFSWIKQSIQKLMLVWAVFAAAIILLWIFSPFVFRIWLGPGFNIPTYLSFQFALFSIIMTWTSIFAFFVNGIGKITITLYLSVFQLIVNIPLAIFLAEVLKMQTTGVILATNINLLIPAIFLSLQTKKIISNKAHGIWNS